MALVTPVAVQDGTQTSGTTDYSLTGTTVTGRRSLAHAVTDGDVANSDTLYYVVIDDTTTGASLDWEYGLGTVSSSGAAVSRSDANVISSSNGGNRVSWGAGGTRTFIVVTGDWALAANNGSEFTAATFATNLGLPRLAAANTFTEENQTISKSSSGAFVTGLSIANTAAANVNNRPSLTLDALNSAGVSLRALRLSAKLSTTTAGSETSTVELFTYSAGAQGSNVKLVGNSLQDASGNKYHPFSSGAKLLWGSTPDPGWTRVNETSGRLIRLATSGDTVGATGGSDDIFDGSWATQGAVLTVAQLPAHDHNVKSQTVEVASGTGAFPDGIVNPGAGNITVNSETIGSGDSHSHSMTLPSYRIACWATKD